MNKPVPLAYEQVPANITAICTRRMGPFVRAELRQASILGQIDLQHLANSAYLQGMLDAVYAIKKGES